VRAQSTALGFLSISKPASYVQEISSGVAKFCLEQAGQTDGIIITGDLATTGQMRDLNVAYSFIADPAVDGYITQDRFPTLTPTNLPICLFPGNHDKYANDEGEPNCAHFELRFQDFMGRFEYSVGHWIRRKQGRLLGLIFADLCLQSRLAASDRVIAVYGQGRVYDDVLATLKNRTVDLRNRYHNIALVWLIHFAPFECGYGLQLHNWHSIVEAAVPLGVKATLCGHTHKASKTIIDKHVIYCAGSAGCVDSEADSRVHLLHFDVDDVFQISRESFLWNADAHAFVHSDDD
jgi:Calcineurin-like phosphoesterase